MADLPVVVVGAGLAGLACARTLGDDGIDVIVTKTLRENRAGVFSQGDIGSIDIPPGQAAYEHLATCSEEDTSGLLAEPMHVFSSFLHAHKLGTAITSDIVRGGETISIADVNDPALIVAKAQGRTEVVVVMDDHVEPDAYWPCFQAIASRF